MKVHQLWWVPFSCQCYTLPQAPYTVDYFTQKDRFSVIFVGKIIAESKTTPSTLYNAPNNVYAILDFSYDAIVQFKTPQLSIRKQNISLSVNALSNLLKTTPYVVSNE